MNKKIFSVMLVLFFQIAILSGESAEEKTLTGTWAGTLYRQISCPVKITIDNVTANFFIGQIEYPTLGYRARLYLSKTKNDKYYLLELSEHIVSKWYKGFISIHLKIKNPETIECEWFQPEGESKGKKAHATLQKKVGTAQVSNTLIGVWEGNAIRWTENPEQYSSPVLINIKNIKKGKNIGSIDYTNQGHVVSLEYLGWQEGKFLFREIPVYRSNPFLISGGTIILKFMKGNTLDYENFDSYGTKRSYAALKRKSFRMLEETNIRRYTYKIMHTYPHDPQAFTQGITYEDGFLFEGTGIRKKSTLRKVELESGKIVLNYKLANKYFGEGITIFSGNIYQLTYLSKVCFVYDKKSFKLLKTFTYPVETEGWGLTHNGKNLVMSDGSSTLYFIDPNSFSLTGKIEVYDNYGPVSFLNELEFFLGKIYANVYGLNYIVIISPQTGRVLGFINLEGLLKPGERGENIDVLNGIAWDKQDSRLFVTGKNWPKIFEISIVSQD